MSNPPNGTFAVTFAKRWGTIQTSMRRQAAKLIFAVLFTITAFQPAFGFALLGPFAPWMTQEIGYAFPGDIGGPMNIGEGYRWNVPVITYAYDQSFLNYYGSNGLNAIEGAIQILNDLPPASSLNISNYALDTLRVNYQAQSLELLDLKSVALSLLVEHMGLADPTLYVYCLHDFSFINGTTNYTVLMRNFDPVTFEPSDSIDGSPFSFYLSLNGNPVYPWQSPPTPPATPYIATTDNFTYPGGWPNAVAELIDENWGMYFAGLTFDDVGGLSYLLSTNNLALESLIPGVTGAGLNATNYVNTAIRPGIDKITFLRIQYDSILGQYFPITNQYVDSYVSNGVVQHQTLQRVVTQPDILFSVQDLPGRTAFRSDTSNWVNNGAPFADGPGVIQPPVTIAFDTTGPSSGHSGSDYNNTNNFGSPAFLPLGSFDGSTNPIVVYPVNLLGPTEFRFFLFPGEQVSTWSLSGQSNSLFLLQTSTDLSNWTTITTVTNVGGTYTYVDDTRGNSPNRFFRTIPKN